jgi:uncharacterized protein (DUF433 family)
VVIEEVIQPFFQDIEFYHDSDLAKRWFPMGAGGGIMLDPAIAMGEPVLSDFGVQTSLLASLVASGDSVEKVADWYEVPPSDVRRAVHFENRLLGRVAA